MPDEVSYKTAFYHLLGGLSVIIQRLEYDETHPAMHGNHLADYRRSIKDAIAGAARAGHTTDEN